MSDGGSEKDGSLLKSAAPAIAKRTAALISREPGDAAGTCDRGSLRREQACDAVFIEAQRLGGSGGGRVEGDKE